MQPQNVLIDIDCLLDTRLGLFHQAFPSAFKKLDLTSYCDRNHNRLWELFGISKKRWDKRWRERTVAAMESCQPTTLLFNLKPIIVNKYIDGKTSPVHDPLHLYINIYPYRLSDEERVEVVNAVREWTMEDIDIETVYLAPRKMTPSIIKERYQSIFMLDFVSWMETHGPELADARMPCVMFNVPAFVHDDNKELMSAADRESIDPFKLTQQSLAEYLSLELLSPELFSLPKPHPS